MYLKMQMSVYCDFQNFCGVIFKTSVVFNSQHEEDLHWYESTSYQGMFRNPERHFSACKYLAAVA